MSYHIPMKGEKIVFVDATRGEQTLSVLGVVDEGAGIVELDLGSGETKPIRYVDPAGATELHPISWHFPNDDTSRIDKTLFRVRQLQPQPESFKRTKRDST